MGAYEEFLAAKAVHDPATGIDDPVLTPFMGIGSEVYGAVEMGRYGIWFELKPSYFVQAVRNVAAASPFAENDLMTMQGDE